MIFLVGRFIFLFIIFRIKLVLFLSENNNALMFRGHQKLNNKKGLTRTKQHRYITKKKNQTTCFSPKKWSFKQHCHVDFISIDLMESQHGIQANLNTSRMLTRKNKSICMNVAQAFVRMWSTKFI